MTYRSEFSELIFWQRWNECKYIFDGMEKALEKAKNNNPNIDYSEAEKKMKLMEEIQGYIGTVYEENEVLKRLNAELNEKVVRIKDALTEIIKENKEIKKELENIKQNLTI